MTQDGFPKGRCFVCSPDNPRGLGLEVHPRDEGEGVEATYTPHEDLQGPPGILHGGLQAALLDDVAVWAIHHRYDTLPLTAQMEFDMRAPVPVGEPLRLEGEVATRSGRRVLVEARLLVEGEVATVGRFDMRISSGVPEDL